MRSLITLAALSLLSACAGTMPDLPATPLPPEIVTSVVRDQVPAQMLACDQEPDVPDTPTNASTAEYMMEVAAAGRDCREKIVAIKKYVQQPMPIAAK